MKAFLQRLLPLLLALLLLTALNAPALAEAPEDGAQESIIDEEALNQWMDEYVQAHNLNRNGAEFSVGFCYTATGDCWFYNADKFMYSASMYKVPVSMLLAEKEAAGEISQDSKLNGYTLQYLESSALVNSNNDSGHAMVDYLGGTYQGKCSDKTIQYTELERDYFPQDFFDYSYYSARYMTQVMVTLCQGGEERFPHVIEYLLTAQPDSYLNLRLAGKYQVAQKYGAFTERNGNDNNHIAAIVYTPTPIVVVVMTRNVGDYQNRMAEIGEYLANYSLELDEKLARREQEAQQNPQSGLIPELPPLPGAETAPEQGAAEQGTPAAQLPAQENAGAPDAPGLPSGLRNEADRAKLMPAFYLLCAALVVYAFLVLRHALRWRRKQQTPSGARH